MRFPFKFVTEQEQAALSFVLLEHVVHFPESKTDPTFVSLFRKFNVNIDKKMKRLDEMVEAKVGRVLADLKDSAMTLDEIAAKHHFLVVEKLKRLAERQSGH